jgi:hypothetical protein
MRLSVEERQAHLNLVEPCIERGGFSTKFTGVLVTYLNTSFPSGNKVHLCHKCHNSKCSNPKHMYWGTPKENLADNIENGKFENGYQRLVNKHGKENADKIIRKNLVDNRDMTKYKRGDKGRFLPGKFGSVA